MSSRSPIVVGLLAIALVTTAVPLAPTGAADGSNTDACNDFDNSDQIFGEEGYVALSHPAVGQGQASLALYFYVFQQDFQIMYDSLKSWSNGQDAYVVHLGCETVGNEYYCFEQLSPSPSEGFPLLTGQPDGSPPDARIQFYDAGYNPVGEQRDPDLSDGDRYCEDPTEDGNEFVPEDAHYAVVTLRDGVPEGLQYDDQIFGPYTMQFDFELWRA